MLSNCIISQFLWRLCVKQWRTTMNECKDILTATSYICPVHIHNCYHSTAAKLNQLNSLFSCDLRLPWDWFWWLFIYSSFVWFTFLNAQFNLPALIYPDRSHNIHFYCKTLSRWNHTEKRGCQQRPMRETVQHLKVLNKKIFTEMEFRRLPI